MTLLRTHGRRAGCTLTLASALLLGACGLAAEGASTEKSTSASGLTGPATLGFAIATTSLPAGTPEQDYPPTALETTGATGTVTWGLASGSLPPGLTLSSGGIVSGRPGADGTFPFVVRARTSGGSEATRSFQVAVGVLALSVESLPYGRAWSERPLTLVAHGASGDVTFRAKANGSGGRFLTVGASTGRAEWAPGTTAGEGVVDRIEVEDADGRRAEVAFGVMPDPVAHHVAEFGSSDPWYVDFSRKLAAHEFASDFHQTLARLGLRSPDARDATGGLADRLADLVVRRETLRILNRRYGREADGRAGTGGLPITFPLEMPSGYERPAPGSWLPGGSLRYSVIGVHACTGGGGMGLAFQDTGANELHESNTTGAAGELGVFCNQYVELLLRIYGDDLAAEPITDADVATLEGLLYGLPTSGARADLVARMVRATSKTTGEMLAHEVGHSLGLQHTATYTPGSLMNTSLFVSDAVNTFLPEDRDRLVRALPGVGRFGGASKPASIPDGIEPCLLVAPPADPRPVPVWAVPAR